MRIAGEDAGYPKGFDIEKEKEKIVQRPPSSP
jgi:hypothetical protein